MSKRELIPITPISDWIKENYGEYGDIAKLSRQTGVDHRQLTRIKQRVWLTKPPSLTWKDQKDINIDLVEKILIESGSNDSLRDLYPDLYS